MDEATVSPYFVSEKIAKIRWLPEQLRESERFLTGSWGLNEKNALRIWRLRQNQYADDSTRFIPECVDKIQFPNDITGLEFINEELVAASCADGRITIVKVKRAVEDDTLEKLTESPILHEINDEPAVCTAISIYKNDIASVGEDGRLSIYNIKTPNEIFRTIEADSCLLTACAYVSPQEVLTGNHMGIIRMFDIRAAAESTCCGAFELPCKDDKISNFVSCMISHPTQRHIILAGSEEGSITIWDLRQPGKPTNYLSAHNSTITEIGFHRAQPTKLFTAAQSGEFWMWSQQNLGLPNGNDMQDNENINPLLSGEHAKNRLNITNLISDLSTPINSFDAHDTKIICGSDNEAIYLIENMF